MERRKYDDDFEQFWKKYPKGRRKDGHGLLQGGKDNAQKAWDGLSAKKQQKALRAVVLETKHQYLPHAGKWLRDGYYKSLLELEEYERETRRAKDDAYHQQQRTEARKEYTLWIMEQTEESLKKFMKEWPNLEWLVRELRAEIFD